MTFVHWRDGVEIAKVKGRRKGAEVVAKLKCVPWNPQLTTDKLMKMTRDEPD